MRPLPRLLIVDQAPTRLGIRMALEGEVVVVAETDQAHQAIRAAKREQPDLCLVGAEIGGDNFATLRGICRAAPDAAVVLIAHDHDVDELLDSIRAGAIGYVAEPLEAERLRRVVHAVRAKEAVVPRSMVLDVLLELRSAGTRGDGLTARQSQVLGMLRRGHTTAEIAQRLQIASVTVRRHISELMQKLGVDDREALAVTQAVHPFGRRVEPCAENLNGDRDARLISPDEPQGHHGVGTGAWDDDSQSGIRYATAGDGARGKL